MNRLHDELSTSTLTPPIPDGTSLHPQRLRGRGPWVQLLSPAGFEWNRYDLPVPGLTQTLAGLRILQLTDLHLRPRWWREYDQLLERIQRDPPDLLLITGDILEHRPNHRRSLPIMERFLQGLRSRLGVFAILGNHDGDLLGPRVSRLGVNLINGRFVRLHDAQRDALIDLIGSPGVMRGDGEDAIIALAPPPIEQSLRIILSHYPDTIHALAVLEPDLMLAGHTHGGQVCLPGGIPIIRHDSLPRRLCKGVHRLNGTWLIVSRGLGFATKPIRLFCPAEVIELVLRPLPRG